MTEKLVSLTETLVLATAIIAAGILIEFLVSREAHQRLSGITASWNAFFEKLSFRTVPSRALGLYAGAERRLFGETRNLVWLARALLVSGILTFITIPGGRALGIFLSMECSVRLYGGEHLAASEYARMAWYWVGNNRLIWLVGLNFIFDVITILVTIKIIETIHNRSLPVIAAGISADILFCAVLFYNGIYIADRLDMTTIIFVDGYFDPASILHQFKTTLSCGSFHIYTSKIFYISTVLLPTLIYLIALLVLLGLLVAFQLLRITAHIFLSSATQSRFSPVMHLSVFMALVTLISGISRYLLTA